MGFIVDLIGIAVIAVIATLGGVEVGGLYYWLLLAATASYGFACWAVGWKRGADLP